MKSVWKFPIPWPPVTDFFEIDMPAGAELVAVQSQNGKPQLWAVVDQKAADVTRQFRIAGTGHPLGPEVGRHIGTIQFNGGSLVFHFFDVQPSPDEEWGPDSAAQLLERGPA